MIIKILNIINKLSFAERAGGTPGCAASKRCRHTCLQTELHRSRARKEC